ncbi:MAG: hypothetical protein ACLUTU_16275 [Blautia faecis]
MPGMNMLVDIGNGTMSILEIHDGRPIEKSISIEVFWGTSVHGENSKELSKQSGVEVPEMLIEPLLRNGIGERSDGYKTNCGKLYREIMKKLVAHGYKEDLVHLYIIGGGGLSAEKLFLFDRKAKCNCHFRYLCKCKRV